MLAIQDLAFTESVDARIAAIAAAQHGLFTRTQAIESGASRNFITQRLLTGRWERLYRGTYRLAGAPLSWHADLLAACFAGGKGAGASYRSAGRLWNLPSFAGNVMEISVQWTRNARIDGVIVHRPRDLAPVDLTVVDEIPVTTPPRTLIDLAGIVSPEVLEEAVDDALRRRLLTIGWLRWRIVELKRPGRPGIGVIEALCAEREEDGAESESILETKLYRVLRRGGLPKPVRQHKVEIAGHVYRLDFAYPEAMVGIEADGYASRASRQRWEQELARQNALVGAGWHLIRFTWTDVVQHPDAVVRRVARALAP